MSVMFPFRLKPPTIRSALARHLQPALLVCLAGATAQAAAQTPPSVAAIPAAGSVAAAVSTPPSAPGADAPDHSQAAKAAPNGAVANAAAPNAAVASAGASLPSAGSVAPAAVAAPAAAAGDSPAAGAAGTASAAVAATGAAAVAATPAPAATPAAASGGAALPAVQLATPVAGLAAPVPQNLSVPPSAQETLLFPRPAILKPAIAFWTDVFQKYSENQSVVHDTNDLGIIYAVLDFRQEASTMDRFQFARYRDKAEDRETKRVAAMLRHIAAEHDHPERLSAEERRIYDELGPDRHSARELREAVDDIRVQRGVRERTEHALEVAAQYLPAMEKTFRSYGLPVELTRLPLVESSFNIDAYSKDGAAGIWQFIPSSARIYMHLNPVVDDRRDPWLSTDAAARHLRDDYTALQTWPLAITAYNHGRGGIARGLIAVRGTTLVDLLRHYRDPNFGFASRNFYAEFLAALDVSRNYYGAHAPAADRPQPLRFDVVTTQDYVRYQTLRRLAGVDEDAFRMLNPAFSAAVVAGQLYVPPDTAIRVPAGSGAQFRAGYTTLAADERFSHQRDYFVAHRIARGDSLSALAVRYHTTITAIRDANGLRHGALLRIGQELRIPPHDGGLMLADAGPRGHLVHTAAIRRHHVRSSYRHHRVRQGQTLSDIAQRYRTTVAALSELNQMSPNDVLRVGTNLKIPGD
jgi:membrane-bound lytic murein transglycosylase D